jgi:hypothetical protein
LLTFNGQRTEVIFKPVTLYAVKFLPAVNGKRLMLLNFDLTMPSYAYISEFEIFGKNTSVQRLEISRGFPSISS